LHRPGSPDATCTTVCSSSSDREPPPRLRRCTSACFTLQIHNNPFPKSKTPTAPLTARSSPLLMVVPTAMKSLVPDSVLDVSNVTISRALTNSFGANSYLPNQKVRAELWSPVDSRGSELRTHPLLTMLPAGSVPGWNIPWSGKTRC
jgi:hypothetical protein